MSSPGLGALLHVQVDVVTPACVLVSEPRRCQERELVVCLERFDAAGPPSGEQHLGVDCTWVACQHYYLPQSSGTRGSELGGRKAHLLAARLLGSGALHALVQLERKDPHAGLRVAVATVAGEGLLGVEVVPLYAGALADRRDVEHPDVRLPRPACGSGGSDPRHEHPCEQVRAQHVYLKRTFEAVTGQHPLGFEHSCVVVEDVEPGVIIEHLPGQRRDVCEGTEVAHVRPTNAAAARCDTFDPTDRGVDTLLRASVHDDPHPGGCQGASCV
mmetsp:Transcript_32972/g.83172  ORF Transcript_32972/g.83172 Transcript_32972/m.83172 type:complete len:272 (+) Transcript_32972:249-1064(+)